VLLAIYLAVGALAAVCKDESQTSTCAQCETVGTTEVCAECQTGGKVPIDGVCVDKNEATGKCKTASGGVINTEKACGQCGAGCFLHKGGCYQFGGEVGKLICADPSTPGSSLTAGACTTCAAGYFKNPTQAAAAVPPCIACNDTTGFTDTSGGSNIYKGVLNCEVCSPPTTPAGARTESVAVCTKCGNSKYLKTDGTCGEASECTGTTFPKADTSAGNKCVSCGDQTDGITDCQTCSNAENTLKCSVCNNNKKPNTTGTACVVCNIANCANCDKENVCAACDSSKKLSPLKDACLTACPAGTYDSQGVCTLCHTSCSSCSDAASTSCTACYPGHVLSKGAGTTKGTCIAECTGAFMAHCKADGCTLDVGGSRYCDACEDGYAPIDGVCTAIAAGARDASGCKASGGKCTACTGANYALLSGGCYNTKALPGSAVCTAANNGQCQTCANGQTYASGNCPTCAEGCAKCATNANTCTECLAGYYKSGTSCVKCSENSTN
ncbi:Variant-specific surface protein, partial [Giardia duodenalis]